MKYSGIHKAMIVSKDDLDGATEAILLAMKYIRKEMNMPLTKRNREGMLKPIDHIEKALIDSLGFLGVDLAVGWGSDLDLSDPNE